MTHPYRHRVLAVVLCGALGPVQAEIYKWTDAQGRTQFSDQPPPGGAATVTIPATNAMTAPAPQRPAAKRVVMYGASWCGYCKQARRYFASHGVAYSEYDVEKDAAAEREFKRLGGHGVPLILVGDARLSGFSEGGFEQLYNQ
jgi:glutaredoxin